MSSNSAVTERPLTRDESSTLFSHAADRFLMRLVDHRLRSGIRTSAVAGL
jgi:hypothetical protein